MKLFRINLGSAGFSLVEAVLSVGIMSFGFLALAPLLGVGLTDARVARENRMTAQIAATMIEEGRQGTLATGPAYFDSGSNPCPSTQAAYVVHEISAASGPLTHLTLRVTPMDGAARIYADVFPTPPSS